MDVSWSGDNILTARRVADEAAKVSASAPSCHQGEGPDGSKGEHVAMKFGWFGVGTGVLGDLSGVIEGGREVERLGYESVWLGEHVVLVDPQASPSPLPPTAPMLDPIVVLAHLAASTTTLRLGIGVIVLPFRNALVLAKQLASLDVLSAGRLMVGIGVGGVPGEFSAVGVPFERRGRVADEAIDVLRALWSLPQPAYVGELMSFSGVQSHPQPTQPGGIPIHGSGMSSAALRRSAQRCDGWYGFQLDLRRTEEVLDRLRGCLRPAGRRPLEITVTPPSHSFSSADVDRYADLGVDRLVVMGDFAGLGRSPSPEGRSAALADMRRYAEMIGLDPA